MSFIFVHHPDLASTKRPEWKQMLRRVELLARQRSCVRCLPAWGYEYFNGKRFVGRTVAGIGFKFEDDLEAGRFLLRIRRISAYRLKVYPDVAGWMADAFRDSWRSPDGALTALQASER